MTVRVWFTDGASQESYGVTALVVRDGKLVLVWRGKERGVPLDRIERMEAA